MKEEDVAIFNPKKLPDEWFPIEVSYAREAATVIVEKAENIRQGVGFVVLRLRVGK